MLDFYEKHAEPIRVLVFDCWLPGFLYIRHLADIEGVLLTFVHNSERQLGTPAREYKDFKKQLSPPSWVKDFGEYDHRFETLFETEKPDVILVTSMHYLECRSALLHAAGKGILRAFIPHGIFLLDQKKEHISYSPFSTRLKRLFQKLPRVLYYGKLFWGAHFQLPRERRGSFGRAISCFRSMILGYLDWQWTPPEPVQSYYSAILDLAIVYDETLVGYYKNSLGLIVEDTEFEVSGTLDSGKLLTALMTDPALTSRTLTESPFAYYVSSPYPEEFTAQGAENLSELMGKLQALVRHAGCDRLIYRPHPGEPNWFVERACRLHGVEIDACPDMTGIVRASLICGTSSSLLYNAVAMSKPIVTISSTRFKMDEPYYEPLISYPRISLDLDVDLDILINTKVAAIRDSLEGSPLNSEPVISDPINALLDRVSAQKSA